MDQTDTGLKAVLKALTDVVAPALDPRDPLAREQLRLAVDYIGFVRARVDYLHARERFDLRHYLGIASDILRTGLPDDAPEVVLLRKALAPAERLADDPAVLTAQLRDAAMELGFAVSAVLRTLGEYRADVASEIRRAVLAATANKLEFDRHWYAPIGFEGPEFEVKRLEEYLQ